MRVVVHTQGDADGLRVTDTPAPSPAPDEILIKVAAAGVNRPDVLQRQGKYPPPEGACERLGLEVAGEVAACGERVSEWRVGDRVCALVNGGGYGEYCQTRADWALPVPTGWTMIEAAALPENFFTVWHNVFQRGRLAEGELLLVHGGASGIGVAAIALAKAFGARVFATTRSADKCPSLGAIGADRAIDTKRDDFVDIVRRAGGANVILDMVGGEYLPRNIKAAAPEGRIVNIAFLAGSRMSLDFMPVMLKRLTLTGSTLRSQSDSVKAGIARDLAVHVWPLLNRRAIKPIIHAIFPLCEVGKAHELMESDTHIGKIILDVTL